MSKIDKTSSINLSHGSGGRAMQDLISQIFGETFKNPYLDVMEDQARFNLEDLSKTGDRLAFTTDSFVVDPLFFQGGNIGKLAVCGTVNDLAVGGAVPLYLSCSLIIEEGFPIEQLDTIIQSMQNTAEQAGVHIVTGDTKVVHRGAVDKLFINTAGVGVIPKAYKIAASHARPGDKVVINGFIGDHGAAIVDARGELALESDIQTDCAPLNHLIQSMLSVCPDIRCLKDATRGGLATVLNEFAQASHVGITLDETSLPIRDEVRGICEILGLDPLYLANEGKVVAVVPEENVDALLDVMHSNSLGGHACVIGEVTEAPKNMVQMQTAFGGTRLVDVLVGEQLPRIC